MHGHDHKRNLAIIEAWSGPCCNGLPQILTVVCHSHAPSPLLYVCAHSDMCPAMDEDQGRSLGVVKTVVLTTAQEAGVVSPLKLAGCIGSGGVTIASVFDTCIKYAFSTLFLLKLAKKKCIVL